MEKYLPSDWKDKISAVRRCSIPSCRKPVKAKGWCGGHYRRWAANGDPLSGRTGKGEPIKWIRDVALTFRSDDCLPWPYAKGLDGRSAITLDGVHMSAARAVCIMTHGAPPSSDHHACHSCGMGHLACVNPSHIRWGTPMQNTREYREHVSMGVVPCRKDEVLDVFSVIAIRTTDKNLSLAQVSKKYGISVSHASRVRRGKAWSWVQDDIFPANTVP